MNPPLAPATAPLEHAAFWRPLRLAALFLLLLAVAACGARAPAHNRRLAPA